MLFGRRCAAVVAVLCVFAAGFAAAKVIPAGSSLLPGCLFYRCTGLFCFGCGCTRALYALAQGNIVASLSYNLLMLPSFLWMLVLCWVRGRMQQMTLFVGLAVLLLFMLLRNIPSPCFDVLRPPC